MLGNVEEWNRGKCDRKFDFGKIKGKETKEKEGEEIKDKEGEGIK